MNARTTLNTTLAAIILSASGSALAHGGSTDWTATGPLTYTNAAYAHAIHGSPNPAAETVSAHSALVYVNKASGPAIYSYPGREVASPAKAPYTLADCENHGR